jgi:hypothetical protein
MTALLLALLLSTVTAQPQMKTLAVGTDNMLPGQSRVFELDDSVKVTVTRVGEQRRVLVERLGVANHYTVEPTARGLAVTFADVTGGIVVSPHRIIIDGVPLDGGRV